MPFSDSIDIPFPCPKCGHEVRETLARLERDRKVTCRGCGADIHIGGNDITAIRKNFDQLFAKIRDLGGGKG